MPEHVRDCQVCGADAGFPNVRAAATPEEEEALLKRVRNQEEYAQNKGHLDALRKFRQLADAANAVLCAPIGRVSQLVSSDNELFATFYQTVDSTARLPENNAWDQSRQAVDTLLFPFYFQHLRFAALSLDGSGVAGYGGICLRLKDEMISQRATTFEENSVLFVRRHRLVPGNTPPRGYRAVWLNRGAHAVAKLGHMVHDGMTAADFVRLLRNDDVRNGDFIEVNIYGPIHRRAIASAQAAKPNNREDRTLLKSIARKLREIGVNLVTA